MLADGVGIVGGAEAAAVHHQRGATARSGPYSDRGTPRHTIGLVKCTTSASQRPLLGGCGHSPVGGPERRKLVEADVEQTAPSCDQMRMNRSPTIAAAQQFLSTVWDGEPPSDEALLKVLDRLVAAYHETPNGGVTDAEIDAPRQNGASLYKQLAARFPSFGYYPVANPRSRSKMRS
ncbi:hypothetical protein QP175_16610 [Sphingomonas aerolata]|uniref:hypothetical protein n=1 Tax=Sphingomonas aerolata TaxID=185951 RepID=UPI002FE25A03